MKEVQKDKINLYLEDREDEERKQVVPERRKPKLSFLGIWGEF